MNSKATYTLALVFLVAAHLAQAQTNRTPSTRSQPQTAEEIANFRADGFVTSLNLTSEQRSKIYPILLDQEKQWATVKIGQDSGKKFFDLRNAAYAKMRPLLTPEQNAKLDKIAAGRPSGGTNVRPVPGKPSSK